MTPRRLVLSAAGGSAALLLLAIGFEVLGGLHPCTLCLWQRWPHAAAIALGALFLAVPGAAVAAAGAIAAGSTAAIGVFHAGVEQGWWAGLSTCSAADPSGLSTEDLYAQILAAPVVRCDDIAWSLLGLSMAGWNAALSAALAALWLTAALKSFRT